jgi:hypothetical protein
MSKLIIDVTTGEETLRELNDDEIAQQEIDTENEITEAEALLVKNADKIAAKAALLERLGITEDEAKLLLA